MIYYYIMNRTSAYIWATVIMVAVMFLPNSTTMNSVQSSWYKCIRPGITPPSYVFPIVWTTLYILIGIALAQTLLLPNSATKPILLFLYAVNLICNVLWSFAYFGSRDIGLAMAILVAILISTAYILYYTSRLLPPWVLYILIPYQVWILFASILNFLSLGKKCTKK